jgi:hypothetical protein
VGALDVRHDLKMLLTYGVLLILNWENVIDNAAVVVTRLSHRELSAICAIFSTVVSGSLMTMEPNHYSLGSKGIVTLTSHTSKPWAIDRRWQ